MNYTIQELKSKLRKLGWSEDSLENVYIRCDKIPQPNGNFVNTKDVKL